MWEKLQLFKSPYRQTLFWVLLFFIISFLALDRLYNKLTYDYGIHQATNHVEDVLLTHQSIREFVSKEQRPQINRLKSEGHLYNDYFSIQLLSSSYIARRIKEFTNAKRVAKGNLPLKFKMAATNPLNPDNLANAREVALLERFNRGEITSFSEVITENNHEYLYVALPSQTTNKSCLNCHGDPELAPDEMRRHYQDMGYQWPVGIIPALISIHAPLEEYLRVANRVKNYLNLITLLLFISLFVIFRFFLLKMEINSKNLEKTNKRLIAQKNQNLLLLNSTAEGIIGTNTLGYCTFANPSALQLLNIGNIEEILGKDIYSFLWKGGYAKKEYQPANCPLFQRVLKGENINLDYQILHRQDGSTVPVEYWLRPITEKDDITGVLMTFINISKRVEAQERLSHTLNNLERDVKERSEDLTQQLRLELIRSERMANLGERVAEFTHDLSTPISIAKNGAYISNESQQKIRTMLKSEEISEDSLIQELDRIHESSTLTDDNLLRAVKLMNSFKRVSIDQTSEQPRPTHIKELIADAFNSLNHHFKNKKIQFHNECPSDLQLQTVPGLLTQVLTNLLLNSLKYGFLKGKNVGEIFVHVHCDENGLKLTYRDNGVGIDADTLPHIFDRFFTTGKEDGGNGIGLYIVQTIISKQLNGTITCTSTLGEGVEFEIVIPGLTSE